MIYVTLQFINTELVPHLKFLWWTKIFTENWRKLEIEGM